MSRNSLRGFTLIELLVTLSIIALLLSIAAPLFRECRQIRGSRFEGGLDADAGCRGQVLLRHGPLPASLDDLVVKKYMRSVPTDPITRAPLAGPSWHPPISSKGAVFDVKTGPRAWA
jgi:general secretion pathway protein G